MFEGDNKMPAKYFQGLSKQHIEDALHVWEKTGYSLQEFLRLTPSAGKPKSEFIDLGTKPPAPLKATVKQAMVQSGIDPTEPARIEFTSDIAKSFLHDLGFRFVKLGDQSQRGIEDFQRYPEYVETLARPQQRAFRNNAIANYHGKCALSQCDCLEALEAAHIVPVSLNGSDQDDNALLLRADLHRLFDSGSLRINPNDGTANFSFETRDHYKNLHGAKVRTPKNGLDMSAFKDRWQTG